MKTKKLQKQAALKEAIIGAFKKIAQVYGVSHTTFIRWYMD